MAGCPKSKSRVGQGFAHLLGMLSCIPRHDLSNATHPGWTIKGRATGGMVTFQIDSLSSVLTCHHPTPEVIAGM